MSIEGALGVDPSLRHTGLCLLRGAETRFAEIKPQKQDVLSATQELRIGLRKVLVDWGLTQKEPALIAIEKQLSTGGSSSALMFHVQLVVLEELKPLFAVKGVELVFPLPVQLKSYLQHQGIGTDRKSQVVRAAKTAIGVETRLSSHCAEAYYLAQLAQEVSKGKWQYNLPRKEIPLVPWKIKNG